MYIYDVILLLPFYFCCAYAYHIYIYDVLLLYSCFTPRYACTSCNSILLRYIHLYSCFTRTLLLLFLMCVCVPAYWRSRLCGAK